MRRLQPRVRRLRPDVCRVGLDEETQAATPRADAATPVQRSCNRSQPYVQWLQPYVPRPRREEADLRRRRHQPARHHRPGHHTHAHTHTHTHTHTEYTAVSRQALPFLAKLPPHLHFMCKVCTTNYCMSSMIYYTRFSSTSGDHRLRRRFRIGSFFLDGSMGDRCQPDSWRVHARLTGQFDSHSMTRRHRQDRSID